MQSGLPEYPGAIVAGHAHVVALEERFASYSAAIWGGIALAADVEEVDSAAVHGDISRGDDKRFWVKVFRAMRSLECDHATPRCRWGRPRGATSTTRS
jgi:hypothetical protein